MSASGGPDIVQDGLVLCLDAADRKSYNGSGTTWFDRSGNGYDGTLENVVYEDNSFYFSNDNLANCEGTVVYGDSYTVEMVFKLDILNVATNDGTLIASSPSVSELYPLWINQENGQLKYRAYSNSTTNFSYFSNFNNLQTDKWYHIILRATKNASSDLYINGEYDTSGASGPQEANDFFTLGDLRKNRNLDMGGNIALVRIYNREIEDAEVAQNYKAIKSRFNL